MTMDANNLGVFAPVSLADLLYETESKGVALPAIATLGCRVTNPTIGTLRTSPAQVRDLIADSALRQRPLTTGLQQQVTTTGLAQTVTFAPTATFPGYWPIDVYAMFVQFDFSLNVAKSPLSLSVAGYDVGGIAIALAVETDQPIPDNNGCAKAGVFFLPCEAVQGSAVYKPFAFRPSLGAGNVNTALDLAVTINAGMPSGVNVSVHMLARGHAYVDSLVAAYTADRKAILNRAARSLRR